MTRSRFPCRDIVATKIIVHTFTVVQVEIVDITPIRPVPSPPYEARAIPNPMSFEETDFWMGR